MSLEDLLREVNGYDVCVTETGLAVENGLWAGEGLALGVGEEQLGGLGCEPGADVVRSGWDRFTRWS